MLWNLFLAQDTYEAYRQLSRHPMMKYHFSNPFFITLLDLDGYCFFPWPDVGLPLALWCFFIGAMALWIYKRINTGAVYCLLGMGFLGFSIAMGGFFRSGFPHHYGVTLAYFSLAFIFGGFASMGTMIAVDKLPNFGIKENALLHSVTGFPKRYISYVIGTVLVAAVCIPLLLCTEIGNFVLAEFNHDNDLFMMTSAGFVLLVGTLGNLALPWKTMYDRPLLGGGYMQALQPIFTLNGPATHSEMMYSIIGACAFFSIMEFCVKGSFSAADFIGLLLIAGIGFSIINAEIHRGAVRDVHASARKGLWN